MADGSGAYARTHSQSSRFFSHLPLPYTPPLPHHNKCPTLRSLELPYKSLASPRLLSACVATANTTKTLTSLSLAHCADVRAFLIPRIPSLSAHTCMVFVCACPPVRSRNREQRGIHPPPQHHHQSPPPTRLALFLIHAPQRQSHHRQHQLPTDALAALTGLQNMKELDLRGLVREKRQQ